MGCADASNLVGGEPELIENELSKLLDAGESGSVEFKNPLAVRLLRRSVLLPIVGAVSFESVLAIKERSRV